MQSFYSPKFSALLCLCGLPHDFSKCNDSHNPRIRSYALHSNIFMSLWCGVHDFLNPEHYSWQFHNRAVLTVFYRNFVKVDGLLLQKWSHQIPISHFTDMSERHVHISRNRRLSENAESGTGNVWLFVHRVDAISFQNTRRSPTGYLYTIHHINCIPSCW